MIRIFSEKAGSVLLRPLFIWLSWPCFSCCWCRICMLWLKKIGVCWKKSKNSCLLEAGFAAIITIITIATGILAFSAVSLRLVSDYVDRVDSEESQLQTELDEKACTDSIQLLKIKAPYASGHFHLSEFNCQIDL